MMRSFLPQYAISYHTHSGASIATRFRARIGLRARNPSRGFERAASPTCHQKLLTLFACKSKGGRKMKHSDMPSPAKHPGVKAQHTGTHKMLLTRTHGVFFRPARALHPKTALHPIYRGVWLPHTKPSRRVLCAIQAVGRQTTSPGQTHAAAQASARPTAAPCPAAWPPAAGAARAQSRHCCSGPPRLRAPLRPSERRWRRWRCPQSARMRHAC